MIASAARRPLTSAPCVDGVSRWSPATKMPSPRSTGAAAPVGPAGTRAARGGPRRCAGAPSSSVVDAVDPRQLAAHHRLRHPLGRTEDRRRHQRAAVRGVAGRRGREHDGVGHRAAGAVEVQQRRRRGRVRGDVVVGGEGAHLRRAERRAAARRRCPGRWRRARPARAARRRRCAPGRVPPRCTRRPSRSTPSGQPGGDPGRAARPCRRRARRSCPARSCATPAGRTPRTSTARTRRAPRTGTGRRKRSTTGPSRPAAARSWAAERSMSPAVRARRRGQHPRGPGGERGLAAAGEQPVGGGPPGAARRRSGSANVCSRPSAPRIAAPGSNVRRRSGSRSTASPAAPGRRC